MNIHKAELHYINAVTDGWKQPIGSQHLLMNIQQQLLHTESSAVKGHSINIQNERSLFLHDMSAAGEEAGPKLKK